MFPMQIAQNFTKKAYNSTELWMLSISCREMLAIMSTFMVIEWAVSITRCYVLTLNVDFKVKGTLQGGISSSLIAVLSHRGHFHWISIYITIIWRHTVGLKVIRRRISWTSWEPLSILWLQFGNSFFITAFYKCSGSITINGKVSLNVEDEKKISSYLKTFGGYLEVVFIATKIP